MTAEPLAKSSPPQLLRQHTEEVHLTVANLINALSTPLHKLLRSDFDLRLRDAALFHDIGKAASGFQEMLSAPREQPKPWKYRHEALSTGILLLLQNGKPDVLTLYAVLTHHKTLDSGAIAGVYGQGYDYEDFSVADRRHWVRKLAELSDHWNWIRAYLIELHNQGMISLASVDLPDSPSDLPDLYELGNLIEDEARGWKGICERSLPFLLARGFLMAADHLASSGKTSPIVALETTTQLRAEGFQESAKRTSGHVLLEAPTGSGKTEAALGWAMANRAGGERIFYVLPFQASINKMEDRLVSIFGADAVGILHHRAALQEFERHFDGEDYRYAQTQARQRVDDTRQFYRPIKILTPYQLLKLMFGCRYFEIGLTELLGGLIIFDEIHAYDAHVAALLEVMISEMIKLRIRFMIMTATFPDFLKTRLEKVLGNSTTIQVMADDPRAKQLLDTARHHLRLHSVPLVALLPEMLTDLADGNKILVVCNRVSQAQGLYLALKSHEATTGKRVDLLHSRFISQDRAIKEQNLYLYPDSTDSLMQQVPAADILVATQVVEVSLNVSFDTIYTEIAPVDALLQRFGRVNRQNQRGRAVEVHVATQYDAKAVGRIYSTERIEQTLRAAPDGQDLLHRIEDEWVQATYRAGFTKKEQESYDEAFEAFRRVTAELRPGYSGRDEDFYSLFDNYSVVPIRFKRTYLKKVMDGHFFIATRYVASIPNSSFQAMRSFMEHDSINHVFFVDRRYDSELGLLNEPETDRTYVTESIDEQFK